MTKTKTKAFKLTKVDERKYILLCQEFYKAEDMRLTIQKDKAKLAIEEDTGEIADDKAIVMYLNENKIAVTEQEIMLKLGVNNIPTKKEARKTEAILMEKNLYLVNMIASKRYKNIPGHTQEDIRQEGAIGIIEAIKRFDLTSNWRLSTYAVWWIRQKINTSLDNTSRAIRAPVYVINAISKINKARSEFFDNNNRLPTDLELSTITEIPEGKIVEYETTTQAMTSLDFQIGEDSTLADVIEDVYARNPEEAQIVNDLTSKLSDTLIRILTPREEHIVRLRLGLGTVEEHTLEQIGKKLSLTKERVRQIERDAMHKLKKSSVMLAFKDKNEL